MKRLWLGAMAAGVALVFVASWAATRPGVITIEPGRPVTDLIARAADGATIRLLPGEYAPFDVTRRVVVRADAGAVVHGPVSVLADGARLVDLLVQGGESGIVIRDADDVVLEGVTVAGARLHGIEIAPGSATITGCAITGLVSPFAQGIEVRMSSGRGHTVVEGCSVDSGQEGLVSHVSRVEFRDNVVTGTTLRALVVTEMSEGLVEGNLVEGVTGSALYCGDMSHCEIRENRVTGVGSAGTGVASLEGWGVLGVYHAMLRTTDNRIDGAAAGEFRLSLGSTRVDRFPLGVWPQGLPGLWPGLPLASAAAGAALYAGVLAVTPWARRRRARAARVPDRVPSEALTGLVATAIGVQAFHMLEHGVQVWQTYVSDAEIRSGLLGQAVDTEWVHFVYNVAVLAFAWWLAIGVGRGRWGRSAATGAGAALLLAAAVIQTYHMAEHVAKVVQHVSIGIDPAPGLLGGRAGLVWFHFAINLAVFAGLAIGAAPLLRRGSWTATSVRLGEGQWSEAVLRRRERRSAGR